MSISQKIFLAVIGISIFAGIVWFGQYRSKQPDPAPVQASNAAAQTDAADQSASIMQAFECERAKHNLAAIPIDPALSAEAQDILNTLAYDLQARPEPLLDPLPWFYQAIVVEPEQPGDCNWRIDLDVTTMPELQAIGIAYWPAVSYSPASVLLIGRK